MNNRKSPTKHRNWFLVFIATLLIILGAALVYIAITNAVTFGWWALLIGLGGLVTITLAVVSIIKNDPSWILLDLVLPG